MTPVELVVSKLPDAKRRGKEFIARCPAHEDGSPSLNVSEGSDGRALLICRAGCSAEAICKKLDLKLADLFAKKPDSFPSAMSTVNGTSKSPRKAGVSLTDVSASAAKSFAKVEEAIGELERKLGPRTADWTYHDADGKPIGVVCRWDKVDGKKYFQPVSLYGGAWFIKGLPAPRPLYRLPELKGAKRVYICEGEKAAEAARAIGLVATTSVHGAKSAKETDWSPLAGLDVAFFPDNDSSGWEFAEEVAEILGKMDPATTIRIVELPGLPEKGDIVEWIAAQGTSDPVELLRRIEQLVAQTDPLPAKVTESTYFTPFPTHILPEPLSTFVSAGAKAIGCDPTYIALPLLVVLAAAIGNTRRLRLKNSWTVPSILWATIVGESGSSKSPAFGLVMRPIKARQETAFREHAAAMQAYEADLVLYEMDKAAWVRGKVVGEPPTPPIAPVATRFYVGDTTIEAIAPLLLENPRGLLLARDELAGWLGSFDRYSSGKGGDASTWLSMQLGEGITVDRKSGKPRTIYVPQACVSICGGIQPGILHRALGTEHRESGLAARLLLCCPPRMPKQWTESDVDPELEVEFGRLLDRLYQLQPRIDEQGNPQAEIVTLTPAAKQAWTAYYDLHARELADLVGDLAAAWSKLEEYAARLALVIHFARWGANDPTLKRPDQVDATSMNIGIALANWFKRETKRVYGILGESREDRIRRELVEWIVKHGGKATARELQMGYRGLRAKGAAEEALSELVRDGLGFWKDTPTTKKGGRPTRCFQLNSMSPVNETPLKAEENKGFVDVDTADDPQSLPPESDWWEV